MRAWRSFLARSNSFLREALRPLPARLMKYVSMRMPDDGPLGETFFEASARAMIGALLVKRSLGGWVESVVTVRTQRLPEDFPAADLLAGDFLAALFELDLRVVREAARFFEGLEEWAGMWISAS